MAKLSGVAAGGRPRSRAASKGRRKRPQKHPLGVLFVHGIGGQPQGETLVRWGESILDWIERAGRSNDDPANDRTAVRPWSADLSCEPPQPAHAEVDVSIDGQERSWLLAEAWWAETFRSPSFAELLSWSLNTVPSAIGLHFARRVHRHYRHRAWFRMVANSFLGLALGLLLAPLLLVVLALLLLLGLLPIPRVREFVVSIQRGLAGSLGDSLILLGSPVQAAAIRSSIRGALRWMSDSCRRVVIVAHSQGAELVVEALQPGARAYTPPAQLATLVTFGAGINKLDRLKALRRRPWVPWIGTGLLVALAVVAVWTRELVVSGELHWSQFWPVPAFLGVGIVPVLFEELFTRLLFRRIMLGREARRRVSQIVLSGTLILLLFTLIVALVVLDASGVVIALYLSCMYAFIALYNMVSEAGKELAISLPAGILKWQDYHASADPVSNGRIYTGDPSWPESFEISNKGSALADHTAYWKNREEFVAPLVATLTREAGTPLPSFDESTEILARGKARRQARVAWRTRARWVLMIAAALYLYLSRSRLEALGAPVVKLLRDNLSWLPTPVAKWVSPPPIATVEVGGGVLLVALCACTLYALLLGVWSGWNAWDMRSFARQAKSLSVAPLVIWITLLVGTLALAWLADPTIASVLGLPPAEGEGPKASLESIWTLVAFGGLVSAWPFAKRFPR